VSPTDDDVKLQTLCAVDSQDPDRVIGRLKPGVSILSFFAGLSPQPMPSSGRCCRGTLPRAALSERPQSPPQSRVGVPARRSRKATLTEDAWSPGSATATGRCVAAPSATRYPSHRSDPRVLPRHCRPTRMIPPPSVSPPVSPYEEVVVAAAEGRWCATHSHGRESSDRDRSGYDMSSEPRRVAVYQRGLFGS